MGHPSEASVPKKQAPFKLREATLRDYRQIAALESRYGLGNRSYGDWGHLWVENPVYDKLQADWPIGWVLEDEDKNIVGSIGNIPLLYELGGKRVLAATGRSWVVDLAYRGVALLLLNSLISQRYIDLYLNNTVNKHSLPAIQALECSRVPVGVWDATAYWVTNYPGFFEQILGMKRYSMRSPLSYPSAPQASWTRLAVLRCRLSGPLSYPLSAIAFLKDRLTRPSFQESDVEVQVCPGFDDRFDIFWESLRRNHPRVLLAVRTREILEWHFKPALSADRLWIVTIVDGPRIAAYAIFEKLFNPKSGFKRVRLVDYQSLDQGISLLTPLLSWALSQCRAGGVHMLEHTGRWLEKGEFLDTAAPHRLTFPTWLYFYRVNNPELKEVLKEKRAWNPSLFDSDATL